jgi:hypothetical protein
MPGWVKLGKDEALSRMILFGENCLRNVLCKYVEHYRSERPHQGKNYVILFPTPPPEGKADGLIECQERLSVLFKYYTHEYFDWTGSRESRP